MYDKALRQKDFAGVAQPKTTTEKEKDAKKDDKDKARDDNKKKERTLVAS